MPEFRHHYHCEACNGTWLAEADSAVTADCPFCAAHDIFPYKSDDTIAGRDTSSRARRGFADRETPHMTFRRIVLCLALFALAGCNTDGGGTANLAAAPSTKPTLSHTEAAKQCWMAIEHGSRSASLDKRADIVAKCIDDKMKTANAPAQAKRAPDTTPQKPKS